MQVIEISADCKQNTGLLRRRGRRRFDGQYKRLAWECQIWRWYSEIGWLDWTYSAGGDEGREDEGRAGRVIATMILLL